MRLQRILSVAIKLNVLIQNALEAHNVGRFFYWNLKEIKIKQNVLS